MSVTLDLYITPVWDFVGFVPESRAVVTLYPLGPWPDAAGKGEVRSWSPGTGNVVRVALPEGARLAEADGPWLDGVWVEGRERPVCLRDVLLKAGRGIEGFSVVVAEQSAEVAEAIA